MTKQALRPQLTPQLVRYGGRAQSNSVGHLFWAPGADEHNAHRRVKRRKAGGSRSERNAMPAAHGADSSGSVEQLLRC